MAVYGTNLDIRVVGNAINELQKIKSSYQSIQHEPAKELKVNVKDNVSGEAKKAKKAINDIPKRHNTKITATGFSAVQARLKGIDSGMGHIHKAGQQLSGVFNAVKVAGVAAFTGLSGAVLKGAKDVASLQSSYKTTENLIRTGGESAKEAISAVSKMQQDGKRYSLEYGVSQQKIAEGYQDLVKRGHTSAEALGVMKSELQASVASGDDFADVVKVSSQTIESFGMKTNNTAKMMKNTKLVVNDLAYSADATATNFSDLGVGMEYVGATAHQAGLSLRDTSAAMGILSNNGLEADKAGTGLRKAIQSIVSPSKAGQEALQQLGLSTEDFHTKSGKLKDLPEIFSTLKDRMKGMSQTQQVDLMHKLFGTTGQQAALILANNSKALDDLESKMKKAEKDNYVADLAKRNSQTVKMQMAQAQQSVNAVLMSLGVAFMPAVTKASQALARGLSSKKAQSEIKALSKRMGEFGDAVGKYLVAHGKDLWDIAASLGKIGLAIGQGAVDAIKGFTAPFRLFSNDKTNSATSGIANSLKNIAKLTPLFKTLGGIFATYFVASKIMATAKAVNELYKGMLLLSTLGGKKSATGSLLGDIASKRKGGSLTQSTLKNATKEAGTIGDDAGKEFATRMERNASKRSGGLVSKLFGHGKHSASSLAGQEGAKAGKEFSSRMERNMASKGKGGILSKFFRTTSTEAGEAGSKAGTTFFERMSTKLVGGRITGIAKGVGTRLASGISYAIGAVDILRGLTGSHIKNRGEMVGKGIGSIVGTAAGSMLAPVLGPFGPMLGGMLGSAIGGGIGKHIKQIWHWLVTYVKDEFKLFKDIFTGNWGDVWDDLKKGFKDVWGGLADWAGKTLGKAWRSVKKWWNGDDDSSSSKKKSSHKSKQPSTKVVKSLGGNHYSKTDIANVKSMNAAITTYTNSLKKLKSSIKHNDPTKQLNGMNKRLTNATKKWNKLAKPLDKVSKAFTNFRRSTSSMAKSISQLTGKKGIGTFQKDLSKLNKSMKTNKLGQYFTKLAKDIKKSGIGKQMELLSKTMWQSVTSFKRIAKPIQTLSKSMSLFAKSLKQFGTKKDGLQKLKTDIQQLEKVTKKTKFGQQLATQLGIASKAMSGKHSFVGQFESMTKTIIKQLNSFKKSFDKDWKNAWKNLDKDASSGLKDVDHAVDNRLDDVIDTENHFIKQFKSGWNDWLDDLKKAFKDSFDKLPDYASSAMKGIISRLNKGISGINSVIGSFGGDKKLSSISYAVGTAQRGVSGHPGGLAMINDGSGPHKQEIVWQPSKGYQLFSGVNRLVHLEAGSKVFPGELSHRMLTAKGVPHYANGNLSDEEMDKISEQFENNAVAASKSLMLKMTNWDGAPIYPSFGKASAIGFSRGIANVLKDLLGEVKNPVNGDWTPVIRSAAAKMGEHISGYDIKRILNTIAHESGGNQSIPGIDDHDGTGRALGLLQYKRSTFDHYAVSGHHNILSGYDQLLALFNDSNWRGDLRWNGGWGPTGSRRRAYGGHILQAEQALVGEDGDEYIINPNKPNALRLLREAMNDVAKRNPNQVHAEPTIEKVNYQQLNRPDSITKDRNGNNIVDLFHEVVDAIHNINLQPVMAVDQAAPVFNKFNAKTHSMVRR